MTRYSKIICFGCKTYSHINPAGNCYMCNKGLVGEVGKAFRPPRKSQLSQWNVLKKMFLVAKEREEKLNPKSTHIFMRGFHTSSYWPWHLPKKFKEKVTIGNMKKRYLNNATDADNSV